LIATTAVIYFRPPLQVVVSDVAIHVEVQTLGEYPTRVTKVRIIDIGEQSVVWEIQSRGLAQLSTFDLKSGENSVAISHVAWGSFDVLAPRSATFEIKRKRPYILEVWGTSLSFTRSSARFVL